MSAFDGMESVIQSIFGGFGVGTTLTLLVLALFIYGLHPLKRWQYRHIPGPPPTWLLGNLGELQRLGFAHAMQKWAAQYGTVFKVWQGGTVLVVIEDPAGARLVNLKNHARPPFFSTLAGKEKEFDDVSLLVSEGPLWQALRQAWQVLFHPGSLRAYTAVMNASAERLVNVLAKKARAGDTAEMWRLFGCLSMEVICSTALGVDVEALQGETKAISADHQGIKFLDTDDDAAQLQKSAAIIFGAGLTASPYLALRVLFPELSLAVAHLSMLLPDHNLRQVLQARAVMRKLCFRLINKTRQQMQPLGSTNISKSATAVAAAAGTNGTAGSRGSAGPEADLGKLLPKSDTEPDSTFVAKLLECDNKLIGRRFTDIEVASQINTFLLAGYETTASALAFTAYFVAANQDKEAKLLEEIDAVGRDFVPTLDDLDKFPYLDAVFNESMRLVPPASIGTIRTAREDFQLCGYNIRKGWYLDTAMFSYHNNPEYHKDADKFVPERFMTEDGRQTPAFAPFGDGGRSCIGMRFAKAEAKIALIRLYQHFTLRLVDEKPIEIRSTISLSPKHGVKVTVHPRA